MPKIKNRSIVTNRDGLIVSNGWDDNAPSSEIRRIIKSHYCEKFFNKFLNKFKWNGISYQQVAYIMRKFWMQGTTGCFLRKDWDILMSSKQKDDFDIYDKLVFAPWVMYNRYNIYNFPTHVTFINNKAVAFIPTSPFKLDKEAVIGYVMRNKKGVYSLIEAKINQLVDVEMTFRTALKTQKMPWIIACAPEDEAKFKKLFERIEDDETSLYCGLDDLKGVKAVVSGAPYICDKLYTQKQAIENEILTLLGINNIGILQKKEHLTTGEVEENNQQIQSSSDEFLSCLEEFCERIKDVLKFNISVELKDTFEVDYSEEKEEDNQDEN